LAYIYIYSELIKNYLESLIYENILIKKLSKDIKSREVIDMFGRAVTWYGDPDQMIVISAEDIHGTFGNI
jgi:hypothetical protein